MYTGLHGIPIGTSRLVFNLDMLYIIPFSQINKKLNVLNSTFDNAFLFSIGKTSEGRDMMALNVSILKCLFLVY